MHEVVVEHDVGRGEALQAADGDEPGIARAGADQVDDAVHRRDYGSRRSAVVLRLCAPRFVEDVAGAVGEQLARRPARRVAAAASRVPRAVARTTRLPSSATTTATSSSSSPSTGDASAPIGVWQPPPSASTSARSASSAAPSPRSSIAADRCAHAASSLADLDRDDALARRRHARRRRQRQRDARREAEPAQAGGGQHERIVLAGVELAKPRVEIAADRREPRAGKQPRQLRDAADAAGADRRRCARASRSSPRSTPADVQRRIGRARGSTTASRGSSRGSTAAIARPSGSTAGMSLLLCTARSISPREQRVFDFLDEQPLAADFRQRRVLQPIAGRLDDDDAAGRAAAPRRCAPRRRWPATARAGCRACRVEVRGACTSGASARPRRSSRDERLRRARTARRRPRRVGRARSARRSRRGRTGASALRRRRRRCPRRRAP